MKIDPQKVLRTLAAAGCVFLGSSAVLAQNDESSDDQRDRQESRDHDRDNQARDRDSDRERTDRQDRRETRRDERRNNEPWENRAENDSRQTSNQRDAERPGLGVSFATEDARPVIRQVHPGSPAEQMGLRRGDRITQVNGEEVNTARDVIAEVRKSEPGDDIEIVVTRDGDERSFEGELETRRQALVFRNDRAGQRSSGAANWNSDRSERRSYSNRGGNDANDDYARNETRGDFGRSGSGQQDVQRQLDSLERQVQQIHRELDQLRRSLDGRSDSYRRGERQAGYSDYGSDRSDGVRTSYSYEGGQAPEQGFRGHTYRDASRGQESDQENSPGGVVGGARTRPQSHWIDNR